MEKYTINLHKKNNNDFFNRFSGYKNNAIFKITTILFR